MGKIRAKKIRQIGDLVNENEPLIAKNNGGRMNAATARAVYKETTGNEPEPVKGRGWHLKKTCEELDCLEYKSYVNNVAISVETLDEFIEALRNQ
jgi:hypothetical protein